MTRVCVLLLAIVALITLAVAPSQAGKFNDKVSVGDAAPAWENLPGTDGEKHSLADLKDAKAVVVVFTCNHCPVAVANEDRLNALAKDYAEKGVKLVAISVSTMDSDKLPKMKERAAEKGFPFAYLYDESQEIGRQFGASTTPEVFVLDGERKIAYMGGLDNNAMDATRASEHYVRNALDAVLAGKKVEKSETKAVGCGITYEPK